MRFADIPVNILCEPPKYQTAKFSTAAQQAKHERQELRHEQARHTEDLHQRRPSVRREMSNSMRELGGLVDNLYISSQQQQKHPQDLPGIMGSSRKQQQDATSTPTRARKAKVRPRERVYLCVDRAKIRGNALLLAYTSWLYGVQPVTF